MKVIVRPVIDPQREIDLTNRLVSAIAEELWSLYGGNDQLNWLEAERHLEQLVGQARNEAAETVIVSLADALGSGQMERGQRRTEKRRGRRSDVTTSRRQGNKSPRMNSTHAGVNAGAPACC